MSKEKVLFVCVHNSARSQMAQAYLRKLAGDDLEVDSAGFKPGPLNPLAVQVMAEDGIDISGQLPQSVFDLYRQGRLYDYVITVCDESENQCPLFPGITHRLHWPFPDPAAVAGDAGQRLAKVRAIRDQIKQRVMEWWMAQGAMVRQGGLI
ncbi:MAG: arsenate reductase ArsC [Pseudomonadota bacterium]